MEKTIVNKNDNPIVIIGIGEDGLSGLCDEAKRHLNNSAHVFGARRHLALIGEDFSPKFHIWPSPLLNAIDEIKALRGQKVVVLASGDPMHYGIGVTLTRYFGRQSLYVIPHTSSFSLAAARLCWPLQDTILTSLHNRPLEPVAPLFQQHKNMLILAHDKDTPAIVGQYLCQIGLGDTQIYVLEHLGGAHEKIWQLSASKCASTRFKDLNLIGVNLQPDRQMPNKDHITAQAPAFLPSRDSGHLLKAAPNLRQSSANICLPDNAFINDGQLTKQDIRALTMTHLCPGAGELMWDVGAGCGSIAIEWLRMAPASRAISVEKHEKRANFIRQNASQHGVGSLTIIEGRAPEALIGLEPPDAIFIGGGFSEDVFQFCYNQLKMGGRLVANAVTLETQAAFLPIAKKHNARLLNIALSHADPLGHFHVWRQQLPVMMLICHKPMPAP